MKHIIEKMTPVVRVLIGICIALYLLDLVLPYRMTEILGLYLPVNERYAVWQYVTGMFMHHGPGHLLINMAGLYFFGCMVERSLGTRRFIALFLLSGIGSGVIYTVVQGHEYASGTALVSTIENTANARFGNAVYQDTMYRLSRLYRTEVVGASGALYGVMVALAMLFPKAKVSFKRLPFPIVAKYFVPGLISIDLVLELTGFSPFGRFMVAHSAHLGGAFIGLLVMLFWRYCYPARLKGK